VDGLTRAHEARSGAGAVLATLIRRGLPTAISKWHADTSFEFDERVETPPAVAAANDRVRERRVALTEASRALKAAQLELKAAPTLDKARDREAFDAGRPLVAEIDRVEYASRRLVEEAARVTAVATESLRDAQRELAAQISRAHPTWLPEQADRIEGLRAQILDDLAEARAKYSQLLAEELVHRELEEFPTGGGTVAGVSLRGATRRPRRRPSYDSVSRPSSSCAITRPVACVAAMFRSCWPRSRRRSAGRGPDAPPGADE
jgi:hypothetical protein